MRTKVNVDCWGTVHGMGIRGDPGHFVGGQSVVWGGFAAVEAKLLEMKGKCRLSSSLVALITSDYGHGAWEDRRCFRARKPALSCRCCCLGGERRCFKRSSSWKGRRKGRLKPAFQGAAVSEKKGGVLEPRRTCCSTSYHNLPQSEVIRAILLEDSQCVSPAAPAAPARPVARPASSCRRRPQEAPPAAAAAGG